MLNAIKHRGCAELRTAQYSFACFFLIKFLANSYLMRRRLRVSQKPMRRNLSPQARNSVAPTEQAPEEQVRRLMQR